MNTYSNDSGTIIQAPWTNEQVANLREWQNGPVHPYTCTESEHGRLVPTNLGWICSDKDCGYKQFWAHSFSLDGSTISSVRLAWLNTIIYEEAEEPEPPPDRVAKAAAALGDKYGWWDDPVLSPETAVDIVETVLGAIDA